MPHNILFLDQFSEMGGGQKVLFDLLIHFDRKKVDPLVVLPGHGEFSQMLHAAGIPYKCNFPGNYSAGGKNLFAAVKYFMHSRSTIEFLSGLIKEQSSDLIYVNSPRLLGWAIAAAKKNQIKVIWHVHSLISSFLEKRLALKWGSQVDMIIVNSISTQKSIQPLFHKIEVVYNGIDIEKFSHKSPVAHTYPVICAIGRLVKLKGYEDLIRCAPAVKKEFPQVKFIIAGSTLFGESSYEDELKALARELKVEDRLVFAGQVENPEDILAASDLFVHCSRSEGFGLTVVEAMAAGKPIVTTDLPAIREIVGNNAGYYKAGKHLDLANIIISLLRSTEERKRMITLNHQRANDFAITLQARKIEEIISSLF